MAKILFNRQTLELKLTLYITTQFILNFRCVVCHLILNNLLKQIHLLNSDFVLFSLNLTQNHTSTVSTIM